MTGRSSLVPAPTAPIPVGPATATWAIAWLVGGLVLGPIAIVALGGDLEGDLDIVEIAGTSAVAWLAFGLALVWVSNRHGTGDPAADLALRVEPLDLAGIPAGVLTQLGLVPLVYAPLQAIWPDEFSDERIEERAQDLADQTSGPATTVLLIVVVVVGAPIVEELVYRGLLQRSATRRLGSAAGLVAASVLFALVHLIPVGYPGLFVTGLVFGVWTLATDRIGGAIVTHAAFNATGLWLVLT